MSKLTAKQKAFCQEYLIDLNATQAAIRAGYSQKTAQQASSRLFLNVVIKDDIQRLQADRSAKLKVTAEFVLQTILSVINSDTARDSDKLKAAELLGRHLGMFNDKLKVESTYKGYDDYTPEERRVKGAELLDIIIEKRQLQLGRLNTSSN